MMDIVRQTKYVLMILVKVNIICTYKSNEHAYNYYLFYLQVNLIQTLVLQTVKDVFETDEPYLHYENTFS